MLPVASATERTPEGSSTPLANISDEELKPTERFELPTAGLQIRSTTSYATLALCPARGPPFLNRTVTLSPQPSRVYHPPSKLNGRKGVGWKGVWR